MTPPADGSRRRKKRRWKPLRSDAASVRQRIRSYRRRRRDERSPRQIPRAAVPSFFTLLNLFSGFLAITQIHEGRFDYACWLIVLAGFFDALDGMMARLTNGSSLFGIELDSLSDVVSFGVAPGYLVYVFGLSPFGVIGLIIASLPAVCGAVRLARFNVEYDGGEKDYFTGLPIPVQALTIVVFILSYIYSNGGMEAPPEEGLVLLIPVVVVLSVMMISNISFDSIPKPTPEAVRREPLKATLFLLGLAVILVAGFTNWPHLGFLAVIAVYILIGITRALVRFIQEVWHAPIDMH